MHSVTKAQQWLNLLLGQDLPFHQALSSQVTAGAIGELCSCGCHGFTFEIAAGTEVSPLQDGSGLFYEVAFTSNLPSEINMLLFTDERGYLRAVDVTYGVENMVPMPDEIVPGAIIGAWPSDSR